MTTAHELNPGDVKEQVSLVDLLARLGYQPARRSNQELFYLSMLRDSDTNPSFTVNDNLGVWYDHGMGKGGNIIDFGLMFWKNLSFKEVLEKIVRICETPVIAPLIREDTKARRRRAVKIPHYQISEVKDLGKHPVISDYLRQRGVWEVAQGRLQEVYYYIEDQKKLRKHFFAAGWKNELGFWEVRNPEFKGCLGHKGMTFIEGPGEGLAIFEGYFNYLSWMIDHPFDDHNILVLNSLALLQAAINKARSFPAVKLYFDHDTPGHQATLNFKTARPDAMDSSFLYEGFNDYNDKVHAERLYRVQKSGFAR